MMATPIPAHPVNGAATNGNGTQHPAKYERVTSQPENPFASLIPDQSIAIVPSFTLESGVTLYNVPVAYSTRGKLSAKRDNAMVICHALTGSADVADWWGPLMGGPGRAFDVTRFFIVCLNCLGSPYGTASPVTNKDGDPASGRYGPEFPLTTIRDDVNLHKLILDDLGVRQIAAVVGGSMGGMLVLEWAYFGKEYVRSIVPIATSARHSAWGISWGEAQRQSIYCDPKYDDGYYPFEDPPSAGLGAARMSALLTYRSRNSFESRFGRNIPDPSRRQNINGEARLTSTNEHWAVHNEGHKNAGRSPRLSTSTPSGSTTPIRSASPIHAASPGPAVETPDPQFSSTTIPSSQTTQPSSSMAAAAAAAKPPTPLPERKKRATTYFSAQSYLRYQGEKFVKRFDSNCYIAITRKLDTHDVSRPRVIPSAAATSTPSSSSPPQALSSPTTVEEALSLIGQPCLVIGIESDGLFTFAEQEQLAAAIPHARLRTIDSPEGHDAFLLQFEQVNRHILDFFADVLPDLMAGPAGGSSGGSGGESEGGVEGRHGGEGGHGLETGVSNKVVKSSLFGEAEAEVDDITAW